MDLCQGKFHINWRINIRIWSILERTDIKNTYSPGDTPHSNDLSQVAIIMKDFRYTNNSKTKNHGLHMYIYILPYSEVIPDIKDGKE